VGYPLWHRQYFSRNSHKARDAEAVQEALADSGYYVGPVIDEHTLLVAVTESSTKEHMDKLIELMEGLR